uniref:Methyltransferase type 11 domain-containing protein n=1 Tax=Amphora coffeiformis TaxID=265554 RepID=A0A7S3L6N9_9STRA|mmetsp:Transcript_13283/g.25166  ORF Transcript_13283/g.25166 Transcript_13283/m.25166 type:complete len:341 (+) Transcript_13283:24-1046(+)
MANNSFVVVAATLSNISFQTKLMRSQVCRSALLLLVWRTSLILLLVANLPVTEATIGGGFSSKHVPTTIEVVPLISNNNNLSSLDHYNTMVGPYKALQVEYHEMAAWYDTFWKGFLDKSMAKPLSILHEWVDETPSSPSSSTITILDVACGTGVFLNKFLTDCQSSDDNPHRLPRKMMGIEPSGAMLKKAKSKFATTSSNDDDDDKENNNNCVVEFRQAPAEKLPLSDRSVDIVCSTNAFHFFRDRQAALAEMKRVLKRGGKLVITDWSNDCPVVRFYHNVIEKIRWRRFKDGYPSPIGTQRMLELVQEAGFEQASIEFYTIRFWIFVLWGMHTITAKKS